METKELMSKSVLVMLVRAMGAGAAFIMVVFIARLLGASDFGVFSLGLTIFTMAGVFVRFGLENVVLKRVSENLETDPKLAIGYLQSSVVLVAMIGLIITVILFFSSGIIFIPIFHDPLFSEVLGLFSIGLVPISIVFIIAAAMKSLGNPIYATLLQSLFVPASMVLFSAFLWLTDLANLHNLVFAYVLGVFLSSILGGCLWKKKAPKIKGSTVKWGSLLKQGWPMLLVSSGAMLLAWSDIIIVGVYMDSKSVGIYSAASKTVLITSLILVGMNSITAPRYAKLYSENKLEDIALLAQKSSWILLLLVVFPSVFLLFFSDWIMSLFGKEFVVGSSILIVLTIGQIVNVAAGSVGYLLSMTGKEKILLKIMFVTALFNIISNMLVINTYGLLGVAVVTAFSIVLWNVWAMFEVRKHLGVWVLSF